MRAPIRGRIATSLSMVQSVSLPVSIDEGCNGGGAHPRVCALLVLPVTWSASTAFGSGSPGHWLAACSRFNSLSPSSCPRSLREECQGALCFVLVYVACCKHGRRLSKRRNSNDEGNNGGGAHPRACVPCSARLSRGLRRRRSAAAGHITPLPAHLPPETPAADQPGRGLYA